MCTRCGNGAIDAGEQCDGTNLNGASCASLGFTAGTLSCGASCLYNTNSCTLCGNGTPEAGEECDDGNTANGDGCSSTCRTEATTCDPDGTYTITGGPVSYTCCLGLVSVNVSSFTFSSDGASIISSPSNPVAMTGAATMCPSSSFNNSGTVPGGCTEGYRVRGQLHRPEHLDRLLRADLHRLRLLVLRRDLRHALHQPDLPHHRHALSAAPRDQRRRVSAKKKWSPSPSRALTPPRPRSSSSLSGFTSS
ncbi:MAG: DUF4215 domain-containing protein [Sandaracinaceae bacterium]|nr:DUF4215 domain-containing protein [Sandaracinaceae bacterium]